MPFLRKRPARFPVQPLQFRYRRGLLLRKPHAERRVRLRAPDAVLLDPPSAPCIARTFVSVRMNVGAVMPEVMIPSTWCRSISCQRFVAASCSCTFSPPGIAALIHASVSAPAALGSHLRFGVVPAAPAGRFFAPPLPSDVNTGMS